MRLIRSYLSERSQGLTEFAIIAPLLLLVLFGTIDFGRVIYYYVTLDHAVNEAGRYVVRAPTPPAPASPTTDIDVLNAVQSAARSITVALASTSTPDGNAASKCVTGPIDSTTPTANTAWLYVSAPGGAAAPSANTPEGGLYRAGQTVVTLPASCRPVTYAGVNGQNNAPIQITIRYNFRPITPLISQVIGNSIVITAYASYRTEY